MFILALQQLREPLILNLALQVCDSYSSDGSLFALLKTSANCLEKC